MCLAVDTPGYEKQLPPLFSGPELPCVYVGYFMSTCKDADGDDTVGNDTGSSALCAPTRNTGLPVMS